MGLIALEGMRFYAYHGFYYEEQIVGNNFVVDVYITASYDGAAQADDLYQTINYETIYMICQSVMRKKTKLLETLTERIISALKHQFGNIQAVQVRITKENPVLGGKVDKAFVEDEGEFVSKCGRCGKGIICYRDTNCWCQGVQIPSETQETLQEQYRGCLCKNCLTYFSG